MDYQPSDARYQSMKYNRVGRSGVRLPAVSLGLWHNFGDVDVFQNGRTIARRAFDLGITHFDLANNYGPSPGSAEETFGALMRKDFHPYRDEMIISSKAGYLMWPGPYGEWGSRKYLVASCDQSLARMGLQVRRHLLQPPLRSGNAARRDHGRARLHRALRPRVVRRHLELQPGADREGGGDPQAARHAVPDPPAQLQHVQPLDRRRPARRARQAGHGLHRVLAAGAGPAHQQVPERHSRRFTRREAHLARSRTPSRRPRSRR